MKSTHRIITFLILSAVALGSGAADEAVLKHGQSQAQDGGESLSSAVARVNEELELKFGILRPTLLTAPKVKGAIDASIEELAKSSSPDRLSQVNALAAISSSGRIPSSIKFHVSAITATHKEESEGLSVTLNYILDVPSGTNRRLIGLTTIHEGFRITKTKTR